MILTNITIDRKLKKNYLSAQVYEIAIFFDTVLVLTIVKQAADDGEISFTGCSVERGVAFGILLIHITS